MSERTEKYQFDRGLDGKPILPREISLKEKALRVSAGLALLANVVHNADVYFGDEIINAIKPVGPYASRDFDYSTLPDMEVSPQGGSNSLQLSDTLEGLLSTSGYSVFIDQARLATELGPDRIAVIEQTSPYTNGSPQVTGRILYGMWFDTSSDNSSTMKAINDLGLSSLPYSTGLDSGSANVLSITNLGVNYSSLNGSGVSLHSQEPTIIDITIYQDNGDGIDFVSNQTVEATITPNVDCEDLTEGVSTEVVLTDEQHETICTALHEYAALLPDQYAIRLDATVSSLDSSDSMNPNSKTVMLTYPTEGAELVSDYSVRITALHEILHASYYDQENDQAFMDRLDDVYSAVYRSTNYRVPTDDEQWAGLSQSVGEVEPVWGIITESTYEGGESRAGHPWDNPTEMLSSTASVLAYYPDEFVANFQDLNGSQKQAIRQVVAEVKELIERFDVSVETIIPNYDDVVEAIK